MASSDSVVIKSIDDDIKGRGLFALQNFKKGDIVFEENPLVGSQFLWNAFYGYKACEYCLRPLESAEENVRRLSGISSYELPFPECCTTLKENHTSCSQCSTMYCSENCRDKAFNQYHQLLCLSSSSDKNHPLLQLQETWREIHYPPETASIMLVAKIIATVKCAADKQDMKNIFSQFCHQTVNNEIPHKLLQEKFKDQLEILRILLTQALYDKDLHDWFTTDGLKSLIALIGTNGQGIGTSPLSAWVNKCDSLNLNLHEKEKLEEVIDKLYEDIDKESGIFINNEGSGLYVLQSSCNHSCVPNAEATFLNNNFNLVMEATQDINKGEEISVSYLDECMRERSRHTRIKALKENYLFICQCAKCISQADDPDETSDDDSEDDMNDY